VTRYVIPSRQRAETLCTTTLPELLRLGVSLSDVTILAHPDEHLAYTFALMERDWLDDVQLVPGRLGMRGQRDAALDWSLAGEHTISIDDDIRSIDVRRDDKTLEPIEPDEWTSVVSIAEQFLRERGVLLWGLYPVRNPYFMKPRVKRDLSYIGGGCYGYLSDPDPDSPLRTTLDDKEDFERSIRCYLAGGLARFDWITWHTRVYTEPGGMQADGLRTDERIDQSACALAARYPFLCSTKTSARGHTELRLRDKRPRARTR
jgi:hypothetical protein